MRLYSTSVSASLLSLLLLGSFWACTPAPSSESDSSEPSSETMSTPSIDVQGHRGCRGLLPENTIPAFLRALDIGVQTLEMDVVITKDGQVLLSHEPFMSHEICADPDGKEITEENEREWNIYQMTLEEVQECDCGSKKHPRFPEQENSPVEKPTLAAVIAAAEAHAQQKGRPAPMYNIETKSTPAGDSVFHPAPAEFVDRLVKVMQEGGIVERSTIQSFDVRTLQYAHEAYPDIRLVLLVENEDGAAANLENLGFVPEVYSPYFQFVDSALVDFCAEKKMALIPWTINEDADIQQMLELGVDGIISDYPDRVVRILNTQ
ncbi:MAG: glycerophosphodiester phosphodiesterase family protein [Bacteroidota bacterium]